MLLNEAYVDLKLLEILEWKDLVQISKVYALEKHVH